MTDPPLDRIDVDVGDVLQRTVASLYSHLVTRPTGRAVRLAIETRLAGTTKGSLSLIDLSEVTVLDFSCADEVVAKLLQGFAGDRYPEAFFVFGGVHEPHRDQIVTALERQSLAVVAETAPGCFEILGARSSHEESAWRVLEERGQLAEADAPSVLSDPGHLAALHLLAARRLAFLSPITRRYHSLSRLVRSLW